MTHQFSTSAEFFGSTGRRCSSGCPRLLRFRFKLGPPCCHKAALREAVRAHQSRPIVERIGRALVRFKTIGRFLPKSLLGEAIKFAMGQWSALQVYLE